MTDLFFLNRNWAIQDVNQNGSYDSEDAIVWCEYPAGPQKDCHQQKDPTSRANVEKHLQDLNISNRNQSIGLAQISFQSSRAYLEKNAQSTNVHDTLLILNRLESLAADQNLPFDQEWASNLMGESIARYLGRLDEYYCPPDKEDGMNAIKWARQLLGVPFDETLWRRQRHERKLTPITCAPEF